MIMETNFSIEFNERTTRKYNYTVDVKYCERFNCFKLFVTTGKIKDLAVIEGSIEDIKKEVNNMVEEGYNRRKMELAYKF